MYKRTAISLALFFNRLQLCPTLALALNHVQPKLNPNLMHYVTDGPGCLFNDLIQFSQLVTRTYTAVMMRGAVFGRRNRRPYPINASQAVTSGRRPHFAPKVTPVTLQISAQKMTAIG